MSVKGIPGSGGDGFPFSQEESEASRYEARYRQFLADANDYLELFGSDIPEETKRQPLSVAYVSLALTRRGASEDDVESITAERLFDRLDGLGRRLLIRGEAGSGKSTLLRWAAVQANTDPKDTGKQTHWDHEGIARFEDFAERKSGKRMADWRRFVPFLIRLRDCPEGIPAVEDFAKPVAHYIGAPPPGWIIQALTDGRALVMIDGVDEVGRFDRPHHAAAIGRLVTAFPRACFVVTSRPAAVPEGWLGRHGFADAEISPLARPDQAVLIGRWHTAMAEATPDRRSLIKEREEQFRTRLEGDPPLARLGSNPLMLAMLCALHYRLGSHLPERAYTLCDKLCTLLVDERDRLSGLKNQRIDPVWASLDSERKRVMLREIAFFLVTGTPTGIGSSIDTATMDAVLSRALKGFGMADVPVEPFRQTVVERSGLLRESAPGRIDFLHNTLKEFLAAEQFIEMRMEHALAERAEDPEWRPVLLFAAGGRSRSFTDALFRKLSERQATASGTTRRRLRVMAWASGAVAVQIDPDLRTQHTALEAEMIPPRTFEEAELLAEAGEHVLPALARAKPKGAKQAAAVARTLRQVGTPRARALMQERFQNDTRRTVLDELVQQVNPLSIPGVQQRLLSGKALEDGWRRFVTDLSPLAGLSGLQVLDLGETSVTDLSPLAGLGGLRVLGLVATSVTDLSPLAGLNGLRVLALSRTNVTDLSPLAGLGDLEVLYFGGTGVTDLSPLAGLHNLQTLTLWRTKVEDLTPLAGLHNLRELNLNNTGVTDLSPLAGLHNLRELNLNNTGVTDLSPLAGLTELEINGVGEELISSHQAKKGGIPAMPISTDAVERSSADTTSESLSNRVKISFGSEDDFAEALSVESFDLEVSLVSSTGNFVAIDRPEGMSDDEFLSLLHRFGGPNARIVNDVQYALEDDEVTFDPEDMADPGEAEATLDDVLHEIGAFKIHNRTRGEGVSIAVVDTGVNGDRAEFPMAKRADGIAFGGQNPWTDTRGHGTMCACIATATQAQGGQFRGVAPEARLISCKTAFHRTELTAIYNTLAERAERGEVIVATNSFGRRTGTPPNEPPDADFDAAIARAIAAGVMFVFSAGNYHRMVGGTDQSCGPNSIWLHKGRADVMTVGTCDLEGAMWYYSSRGPGQFPDRDGHGPKPDVIAPTPRNGLVLHGAQERSKRNGWGTSGAAPQVAGLLALLLSARPDLPRPELADIVRDTARSLGLGAYCQGAGVINCSAAFDRVAAMP